MGVDLNYQGARGGLNPRHRTTQFASRPRNESNSIDFSQSLTQILSCLGHNSNANPKEGFTVVSACTDTWKETMTTRHNNQEERILSLEHHLLGMNNTIQGSQTFFLGLQAKFRRLYDMVTRHETVIPGLHVEVESSLQRINSILTRVEEFQTWINQVKQTNMNGEIPMKIVNSMNEVIQDNAPSVTVENMHLQVEELS